jgi:ATP-dependent Clp protease ATP-binding subunit ClpA
LTLAQEEARLLNHSFIGTDHILLGLIDEDEGLAAKALESLGISLEAVREKVEEMIGPPAGSAPTGSPPFTPRAKKVLELSSIEALQLGHNYIGTEHILLGLAREGEGVAAQVPVSLGADLPRVRQRVIALISGSDLGVPSPQERIPESPRARVGTEWTAQVVRAGRGPAEFADAYQALVDLGAGLGVDVADTSRISVSSVETNEGPGLRLLFRHRFDDSTNVPEGDEKKPDGD